MYIAQFLLLVLFAAFVGCRTTNQVYDPEYAELIHSPHHAAAHETIPETRPNLEGRHSVDEHIQIALGRNPEIQAARKKVESLAYQVPVAASLQDPTLNVTAQPAPVQTAAGRQEWVISASQKLPGRGKLDTRAAVAQSQTEVARSQLAAVELDIVAKVKRAYYELYFLQQAIKTTEAERNLLNEIRKVANKRYQTNQASQQDVLRADLEVFRIQNELIRLQQQLASGQARLARALHVAPQTKLLAVDELPPKQLAWKTQGDLEQLQRQAIAARPELHAQLAAVGRDQWAVELARLDYKPDVTLGFSWIDVASAGISPVANGRDAFLLTAGVNLPIYKNRLESSVRSAQAKAVSTARQYDALRDGALEEVTDLFAQARSQQELLTLFREGILPKARQTLAVSTRAYNVGEVDFLQLIDNWRQTLRYEIQYRRLEASLRQTLADLERAVGGFAEAVSEPMNSPSPE